MNKLTSAKRAAVVAALVEGNSIRATSRMTDVSKPTILKLLADLGQVCTTYHDVMVRDLRSQRVQCDEIWSFVGAKAKNVSEKKRGQWGDIWTWTAIDADSKLMVSWLVGRRNLEAAYAFMSDVAGRLSNRIQLTTDGNSLYLNVIEDTFGSDVDFAILQKIYEQMGKEGRYSPGRFVSTTREVIKGSPDPNYISTSYVERANLTMRMGMRRFTRLTNGFSKKAENHAHAVALHFMHYNFCRIHTTLRVSPAMAAHVSQTLWSMEDVVKMIEEWEVAR